MATSRLTGSIGRQVFSIDDPKRRAGNPIFTLSLQATTDAKASLEFGTKVVGGVKPGFEGEHLGLPVLPSVRVVSYRASRIVWPESLEQRWH